MSYIIISMEWTQNDQVQAMTNQNKIRRFKMKRQECTSIYWLNISA